MSQTLPFKAKVWIAIAIIFMPICLIFSVLYFSKPVHSNNSYDGYKSANIEKVGKVVMPSDKTAASAAVTAAPAPVASPADTYKAVCSSCHASGLLGAPKFGDAAAWEERIKAAGGIDGVVKIAIAGTAKGMPPKGGTQLSDEDFAKVVHYVAGQK